VGLVILLTDAISIDNFLSPQNTWMLAMAI
jgi:hypothetical protein